MSKKLFTEQEISVFIKNPYVMQVSERSITLTAECKTIAYERMKNGERLCDILDSIGIDSVVLGRTRIQGIEEKLHKLANRPEGFANLKFGKREKTTQKREESLEKKIEKLEKELKKATQTIDFLKKTEQADLEARKKCRQNRV